MGHNENSEFSEFTCFSSFNEDKIVVCDNALEHDSSWVAEFRFSKDSIQNETRNDELKKSKTDNVVRKELTASSQRTLKFCFAKADDANKHVDTNIFDYCTCSPLYNCLQTQQFDPVKAAELSINTSKIDTVSSLLQSTEIEEAWLKNVQQTTLGHFRFHLDYHRLIEKYSQPLNSARETVSQPPQIKPEKNEKVEEVVVDLLQLEADKKKNTEELLQKSVTDLKSIIYELDVQAKIYSELLLTELDYRDKLKRDQEMKNAFIASYVALERKNSEREKNRRRKNKYSFFKSTEHEHTTAHTTIPYILQDGGPTTNDLSLLIEILKSMEKDDERTPKLISDYVMKLRERFDLPTVIKIREPNGVTTVVE